MIEDDTFWLEPNLLNVLVGQIATLLNIYHKPPKAFIVRAKRSPVEGEDLGVGNVGEDVGEGAKRRSTRMRMMSTKAVTVVVEWIFSTWEALPWTTMFPLSTAATAE